MREVEDSHLNHYGWIDRQHGIVQIPIDRAMVLWVKNYAATQPAPAVPSTNAAPAAVTTEPENASAKGEGGSACAVIFCWLLFIVGLAASARADSSAPIDIARDVRFDQNLGVQVPLDLPFISDTGAPVHLGDYFHQRPVLLVLDYYRCPNLCGIVLNSMVSSLKDLKSDAGDRFEVVIVSIDPHDTPQISALKETRIRGQL